MHVCTVSASRTPLSVPLSSSGSRLRICSLHPQAEDQGKLVRVSGMVTRRAGMFPLLVQGLGFALCTSAGRSTWASWCACRAW